MEVDIPSGLPKEAIDKKDSDKISHLETRKTKSQELMADLVSDSGKTIINKIKEHLLMRVNKLMDEDPECKTLKKLLVEMGVEVNMGEEAIDRLTRLLVGRQTR